MHASIVLDQPPNVSLTNLDVISGRVLVRSTKPADIDTILVKLEGESRTRLLSPEGPNGERPRPQTEYHKILYKIQQVFPPSEVVAPGRSYTGGARGTFTLPPGNHEYRFSFKLPFNNICHADRSQIPVAIGFEMARPPPGHVKRTLPPTMSGFPGEAEIRYFVKATVNRKSLWKENPRAFAPFNFLPIEPPRPPISGSEVFARQKHQFPAFPESEMSKMKALFGGKKASDAPLDPSTGPFIAVDVRLPQPAILTCNSDIPLRLIVKKLNSFQHPIYLQSLQIALIGDTRVRAHEIYRVETNSWVIMSKSNMYIPLGSATDPEGHEIIVDDKLWRQLPLPNTVAPSFITCNIERKYQLDVRIGLSYSGAHAPSSAKPHNIVLPMRLDVEVFSGIAPPAEVLARMSSPPASLKPNRVSVPPPAMPARPIVTGMGKMRLDTQHASEFGANQVPPTPYDESGPSAAAAGGLPMYDDAPPSYEDAIAADLPPVSAPRPQYQPPPAAEDVVLHGDEKKAWIGH